MRILHVSTGDTQSGAARADLHRDEKKTNVFSVPANETWAGVPAKRLRTLTEQGGAS